MSPSERESFLGERRTGIGGSDIASLLQPFLKEDVKYGCRRRLWYDKSGIEPDYPQDDTGPMELGRILEPYFADKHAQATGDRLTIPGIIRHPALPELLVHIDRRIEDDDHALPGVAEIKALGPDMFWKTKREGLITDYLLQLEHGMLCSGLHWGKFLIGNRAYGGKPMAWTHEANYDVREAIMEEGPAFWKTLGNESAAPARLEPDDKRCGSCQWRRTCHGDALLHSSDKDQLPQAEDIRPLLIEYDEVNAKFCEKLPDGSRGTVDDLRLEEIREQIRAALDARDAVALAWPGGKDRKVYFRQQPGRSSWKMEEMVRAYERLRASLRRSVTGDERALVKFDEEYPAPETFRREGVPFKVLRIY